MDKKYQSTIETKKNVKRYFITMLCCIPLLIVVGIFLEGKVNKAVRITIFVLIMLVVFIIVEFIYVKLRANKESRPKVKHEDVFK